MPMLPLNQLPTPNVNLDPVRGVHPGDTAFPWMIDRQMSTSSAFGAAHQSSIENVIFRPRWEGVRGGMNLHPSHFFLLLGSALAAQAFLQ